MFSKNKKRIFVILLLLSFILSTLYVNEVSGDNWYDSGWSYRKYHIINLSIGAGTNYQVNVTVHYGSGTDSGSNVYLNNKCRSDFGDIRFTKVDGTTLLDYWIESKTDGVKATFWVEIADDLSAVSRTIYLYYGKSGATSTSNGANTFIFFDDFETNLDKWTLYGKTGLRFSGTNNLGSPLGFGTIADFNGTLPFTLECWFKTTGMGTQPLIVRMNLPYQVPGGGNGRGYALFLYNGRVWVELRNSAYEPINEILIGGNARTVNDGNWHHVVATYDGSQKASGIHIYLDKVEETFDVQMDTLNGTISCPARFNVATYGGFYWFTGDVDETVVYTSVLTLSDVITRYNNGTGTETISSGDVYAHWTMDEGSGTDVIDVSGHPERNLWLSVGVGSTNPLWVTGVVEASAITTDYAFSGIKSVEIPVGDLASHVQLPYGDKAVHVRFYDEMSPLSEYAVVSTDAGEAEVSYIGLMNDVGQYEYRLQDTTYNSGINRVVGWHSFVTRSTTNLKQFLIDGNLMPNTGIENYCPNTFLITSNTAEAPSYWDTVFITKFVNPEPSHGMWSGEDNGHILTTTILSTDRATTCVTSGGSTQTIFNQTDWTVILVIIDPLTTVTQSSITVSVTSSTSTSTCTTSKQTTTTTTTPSTSTSCVTSKQTIITTTTASTTSTCTTSKETSRTTTTTCTSTTSKSSTVATTTTTPTTSVFTSKTTTTTPTTSTLMSRSTTTSFTSTSVITTRSTSTEFSATFTSTLTSRTTTTTRTTISSTLTVRCTTTTTESTVYYTFIRSIASVTYTSSTTSIRSDVVGIIYGEFTATGTSIISFTAPVYTASPTAWTWIVSVNLVTTYTACRSAEVPAFVSFLVDRFTLTSATTTEIYDSYIYDAIVTTSIALQSTTINFGTTTTSCSTSVKSSTESTTFCVTSTSTVETSVTTICTSTSTIETSVTTSCTSTSTEFTSVTTSCTSTSTEFTSVTTSCTSTSTINTLVTTTCTSSCVTNECITTTSTESVQITYWTTITYMHTCRNSPLVTYTFTTTIESGALVFYITYTAVNEDVSNNFLTDTAKTMTSVLVLVAIVVAIGIVTKFGSKDY